jgi:integrase
MPRRQKGPRLWLRPARRDARGSITHPARYFILDRGVQHGTGFGIAEADRAERALAKYIASKYETKTASEKRDPSAILIRDVLSLYLNDVVSAPIKAIEQREGPLSELDPDRPDIKAALTLQRKAAHRAKRLNAFFGSRLLSEIDGPLCRQYTKQSSTDAMARRDLEDLRSAISHHRKEGLHDKIISVVLPDRRPERERWLEREEAAQLLWAAWRRAKCQHVAKFILVALYTGRRAAVVCGASFVREMGRTWVDLRRGFLRPPERARKTKKRNPPIPLPAGLLAHLRRWHARGARYVVEWNGHPIWRLDKTVSLIAEDIKLGHITPHVFRHTAATWQMQAGTDLFEASKYLGMTVRTLEETYGHHRPQHLTGARDAYRRLGRLPTIANEKREPRVNKTSRNTTENRDFTP